MLGRISLGLGPDQASPQELCSPTPRHCATIQMVGQPSALPCPALPWPPREGMGCSHTLGLLSHPGAALPAWHEQGSETSPVSSARGAPVGFSFPNSFCYFCAPLLQDERLVSVPVTIMLTAPWSLGLQSMGSWVYYPQLQPEMNLCFCQHLNKIF